LLPNFAQRAPHFDDVQVLSLIYRIEACRFKHRDNSRRVVGWVLEPIYIFIRGIADNQRHALVGVGAKAGCG
jgi:hypothetical protein